MTTHKVYAKYFAIEKKMKQIGMHVERADIIAEFTEGRTESLKDLTVTEYRELTNSLSSLLRNQEVTFDKNNQMRRKVIAILCQCGYTKDNRADMERINKWCITHGHAHCQLNEYDAYGLTKLVNQAEEMLRKHIERI